MCVCADPDKEQVQDVPSRQGRLDAARSRGALFMIRTISYAYNVVHPSAKNLGDRAAILERRRLDRVWQETEQDMPITRAGE